LWNPARQLSGNGTDYSVDFLGPSLAQLTIAGAVAVVGASLAGGLVASLIPTWHRTMRWTVAVMVSWPVGIVLLPVVPAIMDWRFAIGGFCFEGCSPLIDAQSGPLVGASAYFTSLVWALPVAPVWAVLLLIAVHLLGEAKGPGSVGGAGLALLVAFAAAHWFQAMLALVPFLVLVAGAGAWAWLAARWR
jgi:hypothetical protein